MESQKGSDLLYLLSGPEVPTGTLAGSWQEGKGGSTLRISEQGNQFWALLMKGKEERLALLAQIKRGRLVSE